jgi:hypothetical protein
MNQDREHLRILAICHYVYAGLLLLMSCIPGFYIFIGVMMMSLPTTGRGVPPGGPPPAVLGWFFIAFGGIAIVLGLTMSLLTAVAGYNLAKHRRRIFCFVIACINCINVPLGTVLGVFTIIVLVRPTVKDLFEGKTYVEDEGGYDPEDDVPPKGPSPADPAHARRIRPPLNP